jgi:hypothetical protein
MSAQDSERQALALRLKDVLHHSRLLRVFRTGATGYEFLLLQPILSASTCSSSHQGVADIVNCIEQDDSIPGNRQFSEYFSDVLRNCPNPSCVNCDGSVGAIGANGTLICIFFSPVTTVDGKTNTCISFCKLDYQQDEGDEGKVNCRLNHLFVNHPSSLKCAHRQPQAKFVFQLILGLPSELAELGIPLMDTLRVPTADSNARGFYKNGLPSDGLLVLTKCSLASHKDDYDTFEYSVQQNKPDGDRPYTYHTVDGSRKRAPRAPPEGDRSRKRR